MAPLPDDGHSNYLSPEWILQWTSSQMSIWGSPYFFSRFRKFPFSQLLPNSDLPLFPAQFQNLLYLPTVTELNIFISLWSPRVSLFVWLYVLLSHYSYGIHQPNWNTAFLVFSHICNFRPSLCSYYSTSWMHCLHLQL